MDMADEDNADLIDKVREKQRLVKQRTAENMQQSPVCFEWLRIIKIGLSHQNAGLYD